MAPRRNAENENENGGDHMSMYLDLSPLEQLKKVYGEIEVID